MLAPAGCLPGPPPPGSDPASSFRDGRLSDPKRGLFALLRAVISVSAAFFVVLFVGSVVFDTTLCQPDLEAALEALRKQAAAQ